MLHTDSIAADGAIKEENVSHEAHHAKPKHPYQVLRLLPDDATEAQKDSAIQANFQPEQVRYNTRVDTLTCFGQKFVAPKDLSSMRYTQESPFAGSKYYNPEIGTARSGVAGDPVPYAVSNDDFITSLLFGIFILVLFSFSKSRDSIMRQLKHFFYMPRHVTAITETNSEIRFQLLMVVQTCLLFALFAFFYARTYISETYNLPSQYHLIGIFMLVTVGYYLLKYLLYSIVNWTFFNKEKNLQWSKTFLFMSAVEGVAFFPVILLLAFFGMTMETAFTATASIIILFKLLSFYKCCSIFFRGISDVLQIILYFCALEIMPMLSVTGTMVLIGDNLKINY